MECDYILKKHDIASLVVELDMSMIYSIVPAHFSDVDPSLVADPSCDFSVYEFMVSVFVMVVFFGTL